LLLRPLRRRERHAKVSLALQLTGIADRHDHYPKELSGGQEQRVAIARAIVTDPLLILADEPTGDLDRATGHTIMELLAALNRELGKTLVMVTHDAETAGFAKRHLKLGDGHIAADDFVSAARS
jgi:putative ABC transport system ATP-binding protein